MPDLDPIRIFRVGEKQNQNQPVIMIGLSGSGLSGFGFVPVGFRFRCRCGYFAGLVKIWLIFGRIHQIWTRSRQDLVGSSGFQVALHQKSKNIAGICKFLLENLQKLLDFVDFMVRSSGSGFWGGNPPIDSKVSGFVGGKSPLIIELASSGGGGSISSKSGGLVEFQCSVNTPT